MPKVPYDPRPQYEGSVVSAVNTMAGRLPYDGFEHIGGGRYVLAGPPAPFRTTSPAPSRTSQSWRPSLATPTEAPDQGPRSSAAASALWPRLR
jgi:hypothetical protein